MSTSNDKSTKAREIYASNLDGPEHEHAQGMLDFLDKSEDLKKELEKDESWKKNNLEYDLRSIDWIIQKVRNSEVYAQNLYAAMCNTQFQKIDNWCILSDEYWSCSWRYAGGIIADMKGEGDYLDYYCSGITNDIIQYSEEEFKALTPEKQQDIINIRSFVPESVITDEIRLDLRKLGWIVKQTEDEI
jgi:hypothetical protein